MDGRRGIFLILSNHKGVVPIFVHTPISVHLISHNFIRKLYFEPLIKYVGNENLGISMYFSIVICNINKILASIFLYLQIFINSISHNFIIELDVRSLIKHVQNVILDICVFF